MTQLPLAPESISQRVVNVASVPQRSPFRYPGGKTWLVPLARLWLASQPVRPFHLVEAFAGGGIIGLTAIFDDLVNSLTMVELDDQVASVWKTILCDDNEWLVERIVSFNMTTETVQEELLRNPTDRREKAFQTLLKNRVYHGGILAPGSGLLKHGENGKGIKSRWYPETLRKRILAIARLRDRINFIEGDALQVLRDHANRADTAFFIDPPYTAGGKRAGTRLYTFNDLDHHQLFHITSELVGDFLMTYDDAAEIRQFAGQHGFEVSRVPMKNTHHDTMNELLVGRSLAWMRLDNPNGSASSAVAGSPEL